MGPAKSEKKRAHTHIYIYIGSRLGVPRSFEEPSVLMLYQKGRSCIQMGGWGGWGGVIASCEVRWMMLNPGRCCLVGRCCYVASSVVVYRRGGGGWGGCNNVMWSALDDVESWKMLLGWKMLLRCKFRCCLQKGGGGGVITSGEVRWMMLNPGRCCLVGRCCYVASSVVVYRRGVGGWAFVDMKMKKVRSSFRPWFSSALSHVLLLNRAQNKRNRTSNGWHVPHIFSHPWEM